MIPDSLFSIILLLFIDFNVLNDNMLVQKSKLEEQNEIIIYHPLLHLFSHSVISSFANIFSFINILIEPINN
jgi:hypothetical protein